jgi:hypothetical protein
LKAKLLASVILILGVLGLLTQFAPMVNTPATATYTTEIAYTSLSTWVSESTLFEQRIAEQTITDPVGDSSDANYADIGSLSIQKVGAFVEVIMTLAQGGFIAYPTALDADYVLYWMEFYGAKEELRFIAALELSMPYGNGTLSEACRLYTGLFEFLQELTCFRSVRDWAVVLPNEVLGMNPLYVQGVVIKHHTLGGYNEALDVVPDSGPALINTNMESQQTTCYCSTTTSTHTSTSVYTSAYTTRMPLAASMGTWALVLILAAAVCLFTAAIYIDRTKTRS